MELEREFKNFRQQTALKTHTAELEMQLQASLASTQWVVLVEDSGCFTKKMRCY